jgi:hypothetical protein
MRREPSAPDLLHAWELALPQSPLERPDTVLTAVGVAEPAELPVGKRDSELLQLHRDVFGREAAGVTTCTECGETLELVLDVDDLMVTAPKGSAETYVVATAGFTAMFRLPTGADLLAAEAADASEVKSRLLERCVLSVESNGVPVSTATLPPDVLRAISERMHAADPQAEIAVALTCPACSHTWREPLDVGSFLWAELDAWARRLLQDVAALAGAYGWTEAEVIALSPTRRQAYLELAGR